MMQLFTVEKLQLWFAKMRTNKCADVHGFDYCNLEMFKEGNPVSWQTLIHLYNHMSVTGQFETIWRKRERKREKEREREREKKMYLYIYIFFMIRYRRGLSLPSNRNPLLYLRNPPPGFFGRTQFNLNMSECIFESKIPAKEAK